MYVELLNLLRFKKKRKCQTICQIYFFFFSDSFLYLGSFAGLQSMVLKFTVSSFVWLLNLNIETDSYGCFVLYVPGLPMCHLGVCWCGFRVMPTTCMALKLTPMSTCSWRNLPSDWLGEEDEEHFDWIMDDCLNCYQEFHWLLFLNDLYWLLFVQNSCLLVMLKLL